MNDTAWLLLFGAQHWLFDWRLQHPWMAQNKSSNWLALGAHVGVVTLGLLLMGVFYAWIGVAWALVNGALHFTTDAVTSRINSAAWKEQKLDRVFDTIGADQWLLHFPAFVLTSYYMLGAFQ